MKILVTGAAGFIGSHLMRTLLNRGYDVIGLDNFNTYYDPRLKRARVNDFGLNVLEIDITDYQALKELFEKEHFDKVVNLAAQAGVRYSISDPHAYLQSNVVGFVNILEACHSSGVSHLVYASSSSVYGLGAKVPFSEDDRVDSPVSLYAATKRSDELLAHAFCSLYGIAMTGLRFFTVYGPYGRPDMAPMLFADAILQGRPINVFNEGKLSRDFTYIDDIVSGTIACIESTPSSEEGLPYKIYNIGRGAPVNLMDFIAELESALGTKAEKRFLPMQKGDVYQTFADTSLLDREVGYKPKVTLHEGVEAFASWYMSDLNPLRPGLQEAKCVDSNSKNRI